MNNFQERVRRWGMHTFGLVVMRDRRERGFRFCEESLELVQAIGLSKEDVIKLVDYVYGRPIGNIKEEIGGVGTTLASVCTAHDIDMEDCFDNELDLKCWPNSAKIKAKHASKKNKSSSLPGGAD